MHAGHSKPNQTLFGVCIRGGMDSKRAHEFGPKNGFSLI